MSKEAWGFAGIVIVQLAGVFVMWLKMKSGDKVAEETRELARPTGNGFAGETLTHLRGIVETVTENAVMLKSLHEDVRDLRHEVGEDRGASVRHREAFVQHIRDFTAHVKEAHEHNTHTDRNGKPIPKQRGTEKPDDD